MQRRRGRLGVHARSFAKIDDQIHRRTTSRPCPLSFCRFRR
ncbi:hypothetical protein IL54_0687 [Sphingobium sp. ba1]|nr:hypothetical protein IL54_0687 [Sphingobium sp. ba1]